MSTITISIPEELEQRLADIGRKRGLSPDQVVVDLVKRECALARFRELAAETEVYFRKAGFTSEEQILKACSR